MSMNCLDQESEQSQLNGGLLRAVSNAFEQGLDEYINEYTLMRKCILEAKRKHIESARKYLEHGADINCVDNYDRTPLEIAVSSKYTEMVRVLLECGADVKHVDLHGDTALLFAAQTADSEIVRMILGYGADVNHANNDSDTALMIAAQEGYVDIVRVLLSHHAQVNFFNNSGESAWTIALKNNHPDIADLFEKYATQAVFGLVQRAGQNGTLENLPANVNLPAEIVALVAHYAMAAGTMQSNINAQDVGGNTALHYAALHDNRYGIRSLLSDGADINMRNNDGNTPLHVAIQYGHAGIVQALLDAHADHAIKNHRKQTPLDRAYEHRNDAVMDVLSREIIIPGILRDQELFQQLQARHRNVPDIGMPEEIIARIVGFLPNPNSNS